VVVSLAPFVSGETSDPMEATFDGSVIVLVGGVEGACRIGWRPTRRHPRGGIIFGDIHRLVRCVDDFGGWAAVSACYLCGDQGGAA
jgi:hypothetical protein